MKNLAILGSTGSIGTTTLKVIDACPQQFRVVGLAAGENVRVIARQVQKFKPRIVCLASEKAAASLAAYIDRKKTRIFWGSDGMATVATMPDAHLIVSAIAGSAGLLPTLSAVRAGKVVALANKEALVMAGELLIAEASRSNAQVIPVDSEHSAISQMLSDRGLKDVRSIILTASGGPFLNYKKQQLERVTPEEALDHPRWKMGKKVTIDSASLMNKGLEVIEARWLFNIAPERIQVVIHPQSIIHSMVEFVDGTLLAQLSHPDMKGPIAYALSYPERLHNTVKPLNIARLGSLTFMEPDKKRFPALRLAYRALRSGSLMPAVLNAANEIAVQKFLQRKISFPQIAQLTEKVMDAFQHQGKVNLETVLWADTWARTEAEKILATLH